MSYRVVARDGAEYSPVSFDRLLDWFESGRVDADSLVYSEETARWTTLRHVLELPDAGGARGDVRAQVAAPEAAPPKPALAGYTLLANAGLVFAGTAALAAEGLPGGGAAWRYGLAAFDLLLGAGLLLRPGALTGVALLRAVVAGAFFGLAAPLLAGGGAQSWTLGAFHLLFAASLAALLLGRRPVGAWLAGTLAAWLGVGAVHVLGRVLPEREARREIRAAALPAREVRDEDAGLALRLPAGWSLLKAGALGAPAGTALAGHEGTGCAALLQVVSGGTATPQQLGEATGRSLAGADGGFQPGRGESARLGTLPAFRSDGAFTRAGRLYRTSALVAQRSGDEVALLTWCPADRYQTSAAARAALESGLTLEAEGGGRRRELEREVQLRLPFLGNDGRGAVVAEALRRRLAPAELESFTRERIVTGIRRADEHEVGALEELADVLSMHVAKADVAPLQAAAAVFGRGATVDEKGARELLRIAEETYRDSAGELRPEEAEAFSRALAGALLIGLKAG